MSSKEEIEKYRKKRLANPSISNEEKKEMLDKIAKCLREEMEMEIERERKRNDKCKK